MAKILLVISILVTAVTAVLGYMTKGKVDGLKNTIKIAQESERKAKKETADTKVELKTTSDNLVAATKTVEEQKGKIDTLTADVETAKGDAAKAKEAVTLAQTKVTDLEAELAKAKGSKPDAVAGMKSPTEVKLEEDLAKAQQELAEARQVQDTLRTREKESTEKLAEAEKVVRGYRQPIDRAGLTGRIIAVQPGWNFVVIDVGDRKGATVNAPLIVTRNGQVVAHLKITSVEPATSIADVIPGSVIRGQSVQAGDRIVFAGRQAAPAPAGEAPAAGPVAPPAGGQAVAR